MPTPSNAELVAAVRTFLETDVSPQLSGRTAYHAKVAANVLAMVERSFTCPAPAEITADLSADIRSGKIDETTLGLLDQLRASAMAQLAIDNPKYSTFVRALVNLE